MTKNGQQSTVRCAVDQNGNSRKTVRYCTVRTRYQHGTDTVPTRYGHGRRINSDPLLYTITLTIKVTVTVKYHDTVTYMATVTVLLTVTLMIMVTLTFTSLSRLRYSHGNGKWSHNEIE